MSEYSVIVSKKSVDNRNHKVLITGSKTIKRKLAYIFNIVMIVFLFRLQSADYGYGIQTV